jgi:hypothetical protein
MLLASTACAENQPASPLDPIGWLVGGHWVAEGTSKDGSPFKVDLVCEWSSNNRTLLKFKASFTVKGKVVPTYEGSYGWNPAERRIEFFYTSDDGDLTKGIARPSGNRLDQEFTIYQANGATSQFKSAIIREGDDAYHWSVDGLKDGQWREMVKLKYDRKQN